MTRKVRSGCSSGRHLRALQLRHTPTLALALVLTVGVAAGAMAQSQSDQVKLAQQKLQAAGLYHGPVDGLIDPDTRAAIARFQRQIGAPQTQDLDQQTYSRLISIPTPTAGSNAGVATAAIRPPSASSHPATGDQASSANRPGGASTFQPAMVAHPYGNRPGGASTSQPTMVANPTANRPGG
jgi:peptidoglycan hydrolase-like protein with peptidoglycan-binding domain